MATKKTQINSDRQWEIEDAIRTLQRADKIRSDSKLMSDVKTSMKSLNEMMFGGSMKASAKKTTSKKK
jgi:hypothetical protein